MEKEIEIMNFVTREQNKKMINNDQNKPLDYEILGQMELDRRKQNNPNREIFNEYVARDRKINIDKMKKEKMLRLKIRKIHIYAGIIAMGIGAVVAIKKFSNYQNRPIKIVINELSSDSKLNLSENGKTSTGNMTRDELVDYIIDHNLTENEINNAIDDFVSQEKLDSEFVQNKMQESNPEVFNEENYKTR